MCRTLDLSPVFSSIVSADYLTYDADNATDTSLRISSIDAGVIYTPNEQLVVLPQLPFASQVCVPLPLHCVEPGAQVGKHAPVEPLQPNWHVAPFCQLPPKSHVRGTLPLHEVEFGAHCG